MRNFMTIAAVMVAGATFADVSSQVVGYAGTELDDDFGYKAVTPMFIQVSGAQKLTLGDIKPVSSDPDIDPANDIDMQFIKNDGRTDGSNTFVWNGKKWVYQVGKADASAVELPAGKGLWIGNGVDPEDATISLQSAGQVGTEDIVFKLDDDFGYTYVGNGFPVNLTLGDITVESSDPDVDPANDVDMQFIKNDGRTDGANTFVWNGKKWVYQVGKADASAVAIPAGKALWVGNGVDPEDALIYVRVPAPEL